MADLPTGTDSPLVSLGSDVGAVAGMIGSGLNLISKLVSESDRDAIEKETYELTTELQNFFAANDLDSDAFRLFIDRLFNAANEPLTPSGSPDAGRREFIHQSLTLAIHAIRERKYFNRAFASLTSGGK